MSHEEIIGKHSHLFAKPENFTPPTKDPKDCICGAKGDPKAGRTLIANYRTAVLNIPYAGVSEAGNALVNQGYDIGLAWFERGDGITQFSLRSLKGGDIDVSAIAKEYGGGGHQSAAGFQVSLEKGRILVDLILGRDKHVSTSRCC